MTELLQLKSKAIVGAGKGPKLLITGGVHGDEFEPIIAINRLKGEVAPDRLRGRLTLVPIVNEAAYQLESRTASDGLDLARVCPGRSDGSITERIAHALSTLIADADYYIDLHTGGTKLKLTPVAGYMLHSDRSILEQQRQMARAFNLPLIWATTARLDGRSLSVARDEKVPAIYAEWGGAACCDPQAVTTYVEGCLNVMAFLGMIERNQPETIVKYVIEDDRDNIGHLQINYPSPMEGLFEPAAELGRFVEVNQRIGTITNIETGQIKSVLAHESGILVCLRTFTHVAEQDSLATIAAMNGQKEVDSE